VALDRKQFGLPPHPDNKVVAKVPPLPPPPAQVKEMAVVDDDAWRAHDATLVVSDGDRVLADRMFEATRKQRRKK
jgi:hypothetical protein